MDLIQQYVSYLLLLIRIKEMITTSSQFYVNSILSDSTTNSVVGSLNMKELIVAKPLHLKIN